MLDPDEIWIGVTEYPVPGLPDILDYFVDRRYLRFDPVSGEMVVFQMGRRWWDAQTAYQIEEKTQSRTERQIDIRRSGKLLWRR